MWKSSSTCGCQVSTWWTRRINWNRKATSDLVNFEHQSMTPVISKCKKYIYSHNRLRRRYTVTLSDRQHARLHPVVIQPGLFFMTLKYVSRNQTQSPITTEKNNEIARLLSSLFWNKFVEFLMVISFLRCWLRLCRLFGHKRLSVGMPFG